MGPVRPAISQGRRLSSARRDVLQDRLDDVGVVIDAQAGAMDCRVLAVLIL